MKFWVHTAILSIKTVCWTHEFQVPEKSYNIRPWSYIRDFLPYKRPWSYKRVVLCSGKTGITNCTLHIKHNYPGIRCMIDIIYICMCVYCTCTPGMSTENQIGSFPVLTKAVLTSPLGDGSQKKKVFVMFICKHQ